MSNAPRPQRPNALWPVLLLALIPLIPLWRAVFLGEAIGPFDQIQQMAPWNGAKPDQPWDVLQADAVLQFYVWRDLVFEAWGRGQLPLWNHYELGGTPLLANSQSGGFYPPHILMGVLHVPTALAITLLAWFHLFWAGFGVFWLTRRLGGTEAGGIVAGASFSLSAFMISWVGLSSVISTVAWVPWLLVGVWDLFRVQGWFRALATTGIAGAMMLLAGHLQFAAYGFMAVVALALSLAARSWRGDREKGGKGGRAERRRAGISLGRVALALVLAAALAAPQLLPVLSYSRFSHRSGSPPVEEGYKAYVSSSVKVFELPTIAYPNLFGLPTQWSPQDNGLSAYWPAAVKRGGNFAESAIGLGPLVLLLLLALPWRRFEWRKAEGVALIGVLSLLLAFGTPLNRLLYFLLPGWSSTGSPGRAAVLFVMCACIIAGLSASAPPEGGRLRLAPIWLLLLATILSIYGATFVGGSLEPWLEPFRQPGALSAYATSTLSLVLIPVVLALGICALPLYLRNSAPKTELVGDAALVAAAIAVPLILYTGSLVRTSPETLPRVQGPEFERVAIINEHWELLAAAPAALPPNTAALSRIHELGGYDSLLHRETKARLDMANAQDSAPPANGNMMFVKPTASRPQLDSLGIAEVWSRERLPQFEVHAVNSQSGLYRYRLSDFPTVERGRAVVRGQATQTESLIKRETYSGVFLRAEGPGRLVLRDRNSSGWSVLVDNEPAELVGEANMEVDLPDGRHDVEFRYMPPGLIPGLLIGIPAWVAAIAMCLRRRRPQSSGDV